MALGNIKKEIASKYGKALFDAAKSTNSIDSVTNDANSLLELLENQDIQTVIRNPLIKKNDKKSIFTEISKKLNWDKETLTLIEIMIDNKRIFALGEVMQSFLDFIDSQDGKISVTVTSAYDIAKGQQKQIQSELETKLGKPIKLVSKINPKLLGGLQLKIDSLLIDGSLQGKLQRLKNVMKGV